MAFVEYGLIFALGALAYGAIETLYRGFTHWTMPLVGGFCLILLYLIRVRARCNILSKWLLGGSAITGVELIAGIIVNLLLGWNVWDYSSQRLNLLGQICLPFSLLWTAMCIPGMAICSVLKRFLFPRRNSSLR